MYCYLKTLSSVLICLITFAELKTQDELEPKNFKYEDGTISSEGFFLHGQPEGYWRTFYPSGVLKSEGNRKNHVLDSIWIFYNEESEISEKINYLAGKKSGLLEEFSRGELYSRCEYVDDKIEGKCSYFKEGYMEKEVPFIQNKEEGKGYAYDYRGNIITFLFYKDGFLRRSERMNNTDKLARKQGMWRTFFDDRSIMTEGNYVDDEKNGLFKEYNRGGEMILLEKFENGILVTDAEETAVVDIRNEYFTDGKIRGTGSYKNGEKHGVHRSYDEEGTVIDAILYDQGTEVGRGIIGVSGKIEGPWKLYYSNGNLKEEGEYKEGVKEGKWEFYDKEGKLMQIGSYLKGKPEGLWRWYHTDGSTRREESYSRGREDGESTEYDAQGEIISKGQYVDGLKEGPWIYDIGDHTVKGHYSQGEKDGRWSGIYDNGKTQFKGVFIIGLANGKHKFYYESGQLKQDGKYSSGRKNGEWKIIDENGEIIVRISYEQGIERRLDGVRIIPTFEELNID